MQIKNNTSITIYVEGTPTKNGLIFQKIKPGESRNVIDVFAQHIYSDVGAAIIVNCKEEITCFGCFIVRKEPGNIITIDLEE